MTKKKQHHKKEEISTVLTGQSASVLFKKRKAFELQRIIK